MEHTVPGCRPYPPLRVSGRMIDLTYAALYRAEMDFDSLLTAARSWGAAHQGLREYTIGKEIHAAPADPQRDEHFHMHLEFGAKVELRNRLHTTVFCQGGRVLHPEVQSVGSTPRYSPHVHAQPHATQNLPMRMHSQASARDQAPVPVGRGDRMSSCSV